MGTTSINPPALRKKNRDVAKANELARATRAGIMLAHRTMGATMQEIADLFQVSKTAVGTHLDFARRNLQVEKAKDIVMDRLLPKAIAVYDDHLERGNLQAAQDVIHGVGVLQKNATLQVKQAGPDPLEAFREKHFGPKDVIDVEVK